MGDRNYDNGKCKSRERGTTNTRPPSLLTADPRYITVANFDVGSNFIRFEENVMKTFHGGLYTDLKYDPRVVKHICHPLDEKHECCLVETHHMYLGLVQAYSNEVTAFYF